MVKDVLKNTRDERVNWSRYEIKYLISESEAFAIEQQIKPYVSLDDYCRPHSNLSYPIVSLYLDSSNLRLCRESLDGHKNRFKLRIRSYTDDKDYPRFVEIKRRANSVIIKSRSKIKHHNIEPLISGTINLSDTDAALRQFMLYQGSINAGPILRVRYLRKAFEDVVNDNVRVTFDRNLFYKPVSAAKVSLNGGGWQETMPNCVVLEIKFTGHYPAWLSRIVKVLSLRQRSVSKYAISVKKACSSKFCLTGVPIC